MQEGGSPPVNLLSALLPRDGLHGQAILVGEVESNASSWHRSLNSAELSRVSTMMAEVAPKTFDVKDLEPALSR